MYQHADPIADMSGSLEAPRSAARPPHPLDRRVSSQHITTGIVAFLLVDMLLLLDFLGLSWSALAVATAASAGLLALLTIGLRAAPPSGPTLRATLICFLFALGFFLLGGEGRLFYANTDWMVRDAVLHDMSTHAWPYAYLARGPAEILRAPIGMYLAPALAGKLLGASVAPWAMLIQNAALLAALLALLSTLYAGGRERLVALIVFASFSGADFIGAAMVAHATHAPLADHLEGWAGLQYSSMVTLGFWVPHHALAGWMFAAAFLLWRKGCVPAMVPLCIVPLSLLWSPLSPMGSMPFAALVGIETLLRRRLRWTDIAVPALAVALAVPTLLYLGAASDSVGGHLVRNMPGATYLIFEFLEVVPFLMVVALRARVTMIGGPALLLVAALLALMPFWQIGFSIDFEMRASIVPLALLAAGVADVLIVEREAAWRLLILALLVVGSVTGLAEIARALRWPASPPPLCSFYGAWGPSPPAAKSTYLAPFVRLPAAIRSMPIAYVPPRDPAVCWARPWPMPTGLN